MRLAAKSSVVSTSSHDGQLHDERLNLVEFDRLGEGHVEGLGGAVLVAQLRWPRRVGQVNSDEQTRVVPSMFSSLLQNEHG